MSTQRGRVLNVIRLSILFSICYNSDGSIQIRTTTTTNRKGSEIMDVELTIRLTPQGIQVGGPINDKLLCLGLLELAKKSVLDYDPKAIQIASPIVGTHT